MTPEVRSHPVLFKYKTILYELSFKITTYIKIEREEIVMKQFKRTGAALSVLVAASPVALVGAEEAVKEAQITATNKDASNGSNLTLNVPFVAKVEIPTKDGDLSKATLSVKLGKEFAFAPETVTNTETGASTEVTKIKVLHGDTVFRELDVATLPKNDDGSLDFTLDLTADDAANGVVAIQFDLVAPKGDNLTRKIQAELKAGNYTSKTELSIEFAAGETGSKETSGTETTAEKPAETTAETTAESTGSSSETTAETTANGETTAESTGSNSETTAAPSADATTEAPADANGSTTVEASGDATTEAPADVNGSTSVEAGGDASTTANTNANTGANTSDATGKPTNSSKANGSNDKQLPKTGAVALGGAAIVGAIGAVASVFTRNKRKGN